MLLYLTSNEKVNLLDFTENVIGMIPKKLVGKFSLMQFVIRDIRNFAHLKYFVIDRGAIQEDDEALVDAIQSFHMMHSARMILIDESLTQNNFFLQQLVREGITNLVTASEIEDIQAEILESLSPEGMQKYILPEETRPNIQINSDLEAEKYQFSAENVRIALTGSQRRVGTTTTAINLACWIAAHGGSVCYIEKHTNKHLRSILSLYGLKSEDKHFSIQDIDYYLTDELDKDYNFIICDCGELIDYPQTSFTEADIRLLCCSAMPYELPYLHKAIQSLKNINSHIWGLCVQEDIKEILEKNLDIEMDFAKSSHDLFDSEINKELNKKLIEKYIIKKQ